jgi:hypothetical protein
MDIAMPVCLKFKEDFRKNELDCTIDFSIIIASLDPCTVNLRR